MSRIARASSSVAMLGILVLGALLAGCASDPGVRATGNGTYVVVRRSAKGFTHPGMLAADAQREAGDYCRRHDGVAVITGLQESAPPFFFGNYPTAQARFLCRSRAANSADPDLPPTG